MNIYIFSVIIMLFMYLNIWKNVKQGKLGVRDSILWIFLSAMMGLIVWQYKWLDWVAAQLNVSYPPSLLFLIAIILCLLFILDLMIRLHDLQKKHVKLAQAVALLESERKEQQ